MISDTVMPVRADREMAGSQVEAMEKQARRILIADDHDELRDSVRTFLDSRPEWHIVAEAADGSTALELARTTRPDIAIIDFALPLLNGVNLTHALRRELPKIEILLYTIHERDNILLNVLRAGARAYVLKSDAAKHLIAAVEALAAHKPYFSSTISEMLLVHVLDRGDSARDSISLTLRERQVIQLIAEGKVSTEIARILNTSVTAVESHRSVTMQKLNLETNAGLVRYAIRNSLVRP